MIDFDIPKGVKTTRDLLHTLAEKQLRPIARKYDEEEHTIPWDLVNKVFSMQKQMGMGALGGSGRIAAKHIDKKPPAGGESMGLPPEGGGVQVRQENGGGSNATLMAAIVGEEIAWGDAGLMLCLPGPQLGGAALATAGTEAQKEKFFKHFQGDKPAWGCMAITEPGSGSDSASIRTTAVRQGNEWVLNGEKIFATSGGLALEKSNGWAVVWATLDPAAGRAGIKPFLVPAGTQGVTISKVEHKMGIRASNTVSLVFDDCRIPLDNIIGGPEQLDKTKEKGFKGVMETFNATRPLVAAFAVGVGRAALDFTRQLLKEQGIQPRYGLSPARLTAVERDFMQMEADLHAARLLAWRACWMIDHKIPNAAESAMAKAKAGYAVTQATLKCAEIAGPLGYSRKYLLEKWIRDAKINDIFEGTGQVNTLVVARRVLGYTREQLK